MTNIVRARMSENLIRRGLDPFKVVTRKLVCSFRTRIIQRNNALLETIVGSMHFMHSKLTRKWNAAVLNFRPWGWRIHVVTFVTIRFDNFICINVHIIHVSCSMECIFWNKHILSYLILVLQAPLFWIRWSWAVIYGMLKRVLDCKWYCSGLIKLISLPITTSSVVIIEFCRILEI